MGGAELRSDVAGSAGLIGKLDFDSVPRLWPELARLLAGAEHLELSLAGVSSANSAALALLLEAIELARQNGTRLQIVDLPDGLLDLAGLSNVRGILKG